MAKIKGSITQVKDRATNKPLKDTWLIQTQAGKAADGKYQRVSRTYHGSYSGAQKVLQQLNRDVETGVQVMSSNAPFNAFAKEWLKDKLNEVQPRTASSYKVQVQYLCEVLGKTPLEKIDIRTVEHTIKEIERLRTIRNGCKPSGATQKTSFMVLNMILEKAEAYDYIRRNPCAHAKRPKKEEGHHRAMSLEQFLELGEKLSASFIKAAASYQTKEAHLKKTGHQNKPRSEIRGIHELAYITAARVLWGTGMRPSEVLALQWKHIDFTEGRLIIEQATATGNGGVKTTKSNAGKRVIFLDNATLEALKQWNAIQRTALNTLGLELGASSWVICSDAFNQVSHTNLNKWWKKWRTENGFEGWVLYELRHTQVTQLLDNGASIKSVQQRLGHSSAGVTMNIYAHATDRAPRETADIFAKLTGQL